jgi:MFS family permease
LEPRPLRLFRDRAFAAANGAALLMSFGLFGSIFLLSQFFQSVQGVSPLDAGLRLLPWTLAPLFVGPLAGALSDRIGGRPLVITGLALQATGRAWQAAVTQPDTAYTSLIGAFAMATACGRPSTSEPSSWPSAHLPRCSSPAASSPPPIQPRRSPPRERRRRRRRGSSAGGR